MNTFIRALLVSAAALATPAWAASDVVTIYSADGLHDGKGSWFETRSTPLPRPPASRFSMWKPARAAS